MAKRPIRHRAKCPGCGYPHVITNQHAAAHLIGWIIAPHNGPRVDGGEDDHLCSGSGVVVPAPVEPTKGPGPQSGEKVTVSDGITFVAWPKIARLANETMVITEKLDGTNACIQFQPLPADGTDVPWDSLTRLHLPGGESPVFACQSRSRLITPDKDNAGFATWAYANAESLFADLGYGIHFGEYYGAGIQRRYGLTEKHFALFNTHRWDAKRGQFQTPNLDVVPLLYTGPVDTDYAVEIYDRLRDTGSVAVPGFDNPEGIVVYLTQARTSWKLTDAPSGPGKPRVEGE